MEADRPQIRQLLQNLIGHALKFHKEGEAPADKIHNGFLKELKEESNSKILQRAELVRLGGRRWG